MHVDEPREGEVLVVQPSEAPSHWQPVPANGFVEVLVGAGRVPMDTPFGFVTTEASPEMRALADENGAAFLITKPFTAEDFQKHFDEYL